MSQIVLNNLGKSYGNVNIIKGISLDIHEVNLLYWSAPRDAASQRCCA